MANFFKSKWATLGLLLAATPLWKLGYAFLDALFNFQSLIQAMKDHPEIWHLIGSWWGAIGLMVIGFLLLVWQIRKQSMPSPASQGIDEVSTKTGQSADERVDVNLHEGCERTVHNLKSTVSRLQKSELTLGIRNSALETDLEAERVNTEKAAHELNQKERSYEELSRTHEETLRHELDARATLAAELNRYKTPQIGIAFLPNEPYQRIYPAGGRRRVEYYIGIHVSMPVEELIVEFDPYREAFPDMHRRPYQLHENGDEVPYKRFTTLTPEDGEKLFPLLTIEEDIHVTTTSKFDVKIETNSEIENVAAAGRIIARGKNVLSCERSFYVRTPIGSHYRVEFTS